MQGEISNSLYQFYNVYYENKNSGTVRKVNADDSVIWMTSVDRHALSKSLAIDSAEQNVLFGNNQISCVIRLSAVNGKLINAMSFGSLIFGYGEFKIHLLTDNSGYYVFLRNREFYIGWSL